MCKARSLGNLSPIQFIDEYKLKLEKDVLELRYIISNNKGKEGLYIIPNLNNIFEIYYNVHGRKKVNENCEIIKWLKYTKKLII